MVPMYFSAVGNASQPSKRKFHEVAPEMCFARLFRYEGETRVQNFIYTKAVEGSSDLGLILLTMARSCASGAPSMMLVKCTRQAFDEARKRE